MLVRKKTSIPMVSNIDKIKIAFVIWTLEGMAGSERVVFDIVRTLDKNKYETFVLSFRDGPIRKLYEKVGAKVSIFSKGKKHGFNFIRMFRHYLIEENIDILNAHHLSPFYCSFLAARKTRIKILFTEHSVWQLEELGLARKILNKILFNKVDVFIAISEQIRRYYLDKLKLKKNKIYLITNGIDLNRFKKVEANYKKLELGFRPEDKIIGMVATIRPEKNHKMLLSAYCKIAGEIKNAHLVFVGRDFMNGKVHSVARNCGFTDCIHFLGEREDVAEILGIFDIFCLTSFHEGLPISLLEAMACEVPVIGSNVMGINEVIKDKENGILFPIDDEEKLIKNIKNLLINDELRRTIGRKGRIYVEENYNLERKIKDYDALFEHLMYDGSQRGQAITRFHSKD
jgi:glycosyltransferase involved in cell wall biosynthesis